MTAIEPQKPEVKWDQTSFEKLKATWSPERIAQDEKTLKKIFNLAAGAPLMAEALEWAQQHGVKFFIDHKASSNIGGYYAEGTGVLGVTESMLDNPASAVTVITHEIRHAWQDYQGFNAPDYVIVANNPDFTKHFIRYALVEADAKAYGEYAALQYQYKEALNQNPAQDESAYFRKGFLSWFASPATKSFYGDWASKLYGQYYGVYKGALPVGPLEFRSPVPPLGNGINIDSVKDVLRLGENFSGTKNYLAELDKLQPDLLPKKILDRSLANTFWGAANDNQKKLVAEIGQAYARAQANRKNIRKPQSLG
jgi:hypothetical protein